MIYKAFLDEIRQTEDGEEYLARLQKAYNRLRFRKFESHVDEKLFRKFYELKDKWTSSDFLENFRNNGALDENNTIILDDVRIEAFEVPTGAECRAWTILPNTNRLLEKNEADNLEEWTEKNAQIVLHNNVVVSEIATRFFDIESAEYYFASSVERTKVVTPSFLKDDESLVSERSIIGYHTYDFDYIIERVKDYLSLRKIEKGEIDAITFENIKQNIFKRFILCQDQHCENSGLIVDNPESPHRIRMAPLYDFDYSCGITRTLSKDKIRTINGSSEVEAFVECFKDVDGIREVLESAIQSFNIEEVFQAIRETKGYIVPDECKEYYREFFAQRMQSLVQAYNQTYKTKVVPER